MNKQRYINGIYIFRFPAYEYFFYMPTKIFKKLFVGSN